MSAQPMDEFINLEQLADLAQSAVPGDHDLWPRIESAARRLATQKAAGTLTPDLQLEGRRVRSMRHKMAVALASLVAVGVVLGVVGVLVVPQFMSFGGSSAEWPDYMSAERLVNDSDRIVIARFLDETPYEIPRYTADGLPSGSITEVYRLFKVIESLKGDTEPGETTPVVVTAGYTEGGRFHAYDQIPLSLADEYVLFLRDFPRRPEYPAEYGDITWSRTGEPGIAVVEPSGELSFMTTDRFKRDHRHHLLEDSESPFDLTLEKIKALVSRR